MKSLYVDDVNGGTDTVDQGCSLKEVAVLEKRDLNCINGT